MPRRLLAPALALLAAAAPSPARTWTSAGGATVEAELLTVEDSGRVVLERPDGSRLGIDTRQLSAADQEFLRQQAIATDTSAQPPLPPASLPGIRYAPPSSTTANALFPPDTLNPTNTVTCWGFQYGPASNQVLYFAFDAPEPEQPPASLLVYSPAHPDFADPTTFTARNDDYREQRIRAFRGITADAQHGEWSASHELMFRCGIARYDVVMVVIETTLRRERKTYRFARGGYITEQVTPPTEPISVLPALQPLQFTSGAQVYRGRPLVEPSLRMGPFALLPDTNMDEEVLVEVIDTATGRRVERLKVPLREESMTEAGAGVHRTDFELRPGRTFQVRATIDLGPLLGAPTHITTLFMPEPDPD